MAVMGIPLGTLRVYKNIGYVHYLVVYVSTLPNILMYRKDYSGNLQICGNSEAMIYTINIL